MHSTFCCLEICGQGSPFLEGLTPSLSLRALLVNEVQQGQGAPLAPRGVQAHKVPLEQQARKACR